MKSFSSLLCAGAAVLLSAARAAGSTPEDACTGLAENDACSVVSPLQYTAYGTCIWTSTGTQAPQVTEAPNPANSACSDSSAGAICNFVDSTTKLNVEGICHASTVVGFDGLTCEPDGKSEILEEVACDNKASDAACSFVKPDGAVIDGICTDTGAVALKCVQSSDPGTQGSGGDPDSGAGSTDINIDAMDPAEKACLQNSTDVSYGWLDPGTSCAWTDEGGDNFDGDCVQKSGGQYFMCESMDVGTGSSGGSVDSDTNPEFVACDGLSVDEGCTIAGDVPSNDLSGVCKVSPQNGNLFCQPGPDARRLNLFLYCQISSDGGDVTHSPMSTDQLGAADQPVTFENSAGAVVGGVIGALLGVALVVVGGIFIYRKYGKQKGVGVDVDTEGGDVYQTL